MHLDLGRKLMQTKVIMISLVEDTDFLSNPDNHFNPCGMKFFNTTRSTEEFPDGQCDPAS